MAADLEKKMHEYAANLEFEKAAALRDELIELRRQIGEMCIRDSTTSNSSGCTLYHDAISLIGTPLLFMNVCGSTSTKPRVES